jgi:hypothetical protein
MSAAALALRGICATATVDRTSPRHRQPAGRDRPVICVFEGSLDFRPWGVLPGCLTLAAGARPLVALLRDALNQVAPGAAAAVVVEPEGGRPRAAEGPWQAEWILGGGGSSSQPLRLSERCFVGRHDLAAYLAELARRRPGCRIRLTLRRA